MSSLRRRLPLATCALLLGGSLGVATFAGCLVPFGEYDTHGSGGASASTSAASGGARGIGGSSSNDGGGAGGGDTTCGKPPPGNILSVAVGSAHVCALVDGSPKTVWCWGDNTLSQIGTSPGGVVKEATRVKFKPGFLPTALAAGGDHSCAASLNEVYCWGKNDAGQTVPGAPSMSSLPTVAYRPGDAAPASLALGLEHTCAVYGGEGHCWGQMLGVGMTCLATPCDVTEVWSDFHHDVQASISAIAAGGLHSCLLEHDAVHCWGDNTHDQLGVPVIGTPTSADLVTTDILDGSQVVAGKWHSCAHEMAGWTCWGMNAQGQLNGTVGADEDLPQAAAITDAKAFAAGRAHTCAMETSGAVTCWGANDQGQHGDGSSGTAKSEVPLPTGFKPKGISSRCDQTCAFDADRIVCWGAPRTDGCSDSPSREPDPNPPAPHEICWPP